MRILIVMPITESVSQFFVILHERQKLMLSIEQLIFFIYNLHSQKISYADFYLIY